ncbi:MAG: zf-HC2 domain-containing protein [Solirubrobacterales bacterium]
MKTEHCRNRRESLGAYALGHLSAEERAGLEAHLEGCPGCRAEVDSLAGVALLLAHGNPANFGPAPKPSPELGKRIEATIGAERRSNRRRVRRRRFALALSGATAVAAVVLTVVVLSGDGEGVPQQRVEFAALPAGVDMAATLEPHAYGTEIHMYVSGMRSGTLCRVFLRGANGATVPAGTFRYRWGDDSRAVLSSALDLSRTEAIGVRAGGRTFFAPVDRGAAATDNRTEEDPT